MGTVGMRKLCHRKVYFSITLFVYLTSLCDSMTIRSRRESVKIGDLPIIIPPVTVKKGEQKYHDPGWTHCIKYLTASVSWRTIKSAVNLHKIQATQFQCSWYISSDIPNSNIKIAFEKLDFGVQTGSGCTQQFLELIDIRAGKSQGRLCGNKKHGDYVSAGQKVRIDIQGSEPLVTKLREEERPFIISYKVVKEPPGFRRSVTKNPDLKNKVKNTVGSKIDVSLSDREKVLYGAGNQPGTNDPPDVDGEQNDEGGSSLTVWQIAIIVFVASALVACMVGVFIKRKCIDDKKEKEYLEQSEWNFGENKFNSPMLPGIVIEKPLYRKNHSDNGMSQKKDLPDEKLPRSSSKPERAADYHQVKSKPIRETRTPKEGKRHDEKRHTNGQVKPKKSSRRKREKKPIAVDKSANETIVDDTPAGRAPRKTRKPKPSKTEKNPDGTRETIDENRNTIDDRPPIRKPRRKKDPSHSRGKKREKSRKRDKDVDRVAKESDSKKTISDEVATPSSRADKKTRHDSTTRKKKTAKVRDLQTGDPKRHRKREKRVNGSKTLKSTSRRKSAKPTGHDKTKTAKQAAKQRARHKESSKPDEQTLSRKKRDRPAA